MIVRSRHPGLGVHLLTSAREALAASEPPITPYRSGVATPNGL
ncbi:hypothetical protein [Nocardia asiatica]|nr:hypothetical protein [Nocardia asiatica]